MMLKSASRIALAVAAAVTAGATHAQESSVQLYGTLNVDLERVEARGATAAGTLNASQMGQRPTGVDVSPRNRVTSNSSNFGLRGSERFGNDLAAFFQVESAVNVDAGGTTVASRNSAVGLRGGWGSIRIGQWDTPYKAISGAVDPMFFTGITYTGALIGTPGFGVGPVTAGNVATSADGRTYASAANASFERRIGNSVQYWSPSLGGLTVRAAYSANEGKTANTDALTQVNPEIFVASIEYEQGIFYAAYAYERHDDYFGLDALVPAAQATPVAAVGGTPGASSRDRGEKFVARVTLGGTQLGVMAERLRYTKSVTPPVAGAFSRYERPAVVVTLVQKVGQGAIRALYGKAQDGSCSRADGSECDTSGLGARQMSLGYSYSPSRRTDLYAFYTRVENDARGSYQFANAAGIGAAPGAASVGYLLGMRHTF